MRTTGLLLVSLLPCSEVHPCFSACSIALHRACTALWAPKKRWVYVGAHRVVRPGEGRKPLPRIPLSVKQAQMHEADTGAKVSILGGRRGTSIAGQGDAVWPLAWQDASRTCSVASVRTCWMSLVLR